MPLCANERHKNDWHRENVQPENAKIVYLKVCALTAFRV